MKSYLKWLGGVGIMFLLLLLSCDWLLFSPQAPLKPEGPGNLAVGETGTFYTRPAADETDSVSIRFDFGDGNLSDYIGPVGPADTVFISHSWDAPGTFHVKAQAKNDFGESKWSDPLVVTVSDSTESDSFNLTEVGHFDIPGYGRLIKLAKSGNYLYLAARSEGLIILDVSNPQSPTTVGQFIPSNSSKEPWVNDVKISGNYAYIAVTYTYAKTTSVLALDISNPSSPREVGQFADTSGYKSFERLFYSGGRVYVVGQQWTMGIINFTNPVAPLGESFITLPGYYAYDIFVSGSYAYVANNEYGVQIIDISNPQNPVFVSNVNVSSNASGVFVSQNTLYVAAEASGLKIVDVSNPASPSVVGTVSFPDYTKGIYASGDYAYVGASTAGYYVVDVSSPSNPNIITGIDTPGNAWFSIVDGDYAYVADFTSLRIIKLR
ncbi:MAG: PKD domain-containing protein [bacterium]|nr:PKD domain-containing protein [bacterium]